MANGLGQSKSPYIIICSGRIDVAVARDAAGRIKAASDAARNLVTFYGDAVTNEETQPISELQHEMMELVQGRAAARTSADRMVSEMFALLDALEEAHEG